MPEEPQLIEADRENEARAWPGLLGHTGAAATRPISGCFFLLPLAPLPLCSCLVVCTPGGLSAKQHAHPVVATWLHGAWLGQPWAPALSRRKAGPQELPAPIGHLGKLRPRKNSSTPGPRPGGELGDLVSASALARN